MTGSNRYIVANFIKEGDREIMIESKIKAKIALKIPLTAKERAYYLLYIATLEEAKEYIKNEVKQK